MDLLADDNNTTTTTTQKTEFIDQLPKQTPPDMDEEVELFLSYAEYERLYNSGVLRRQDVVGGKVKRRDFLRIREFLQQHMTDLEREAFDQNHDILLGEDYASAVDCGLKRVDSKRYKRDYDVHKDENGVKKQPKWEVQFPRSPVTSPENLVFATPAGRREDPVQEIAMNEAEDQVR